MRLLTDGADMKGEGVFRADSNEEEFLACARYGWVLAEQNENDAVRANLLKLVWAWLAAANDLEKAASNPGWDTTPP